jgi:SAM-dependent methyltransferase
MSWDFIPTEVGGGDESGFGAGGDEPYARALGSDGRLELHADDRPDEVREYDVARWSAAADRVDLSLFRDVDGPVIDLGCGPGRMLVAARDLGLPALGIDLSPAAVEIAGRSGVPVLRGSVFDPVPQEGHWDTALLIDGNIGIGGDPVALLSRARAIVRSGGSVIVEASADDDVDRRFDATITDESGRVSAHFPWAELGRVAIAAAADRAGLHLRATWTEDARTFLVLTS